MRYLIFGTGAIGGYFGGRLLQHKTHQQVDFIARGKQLSAIKSNGLALKSINGNTLLSTINVSEKINDNIQYDVIFIAVKSYQLKQAVAEIIRACGKKTVVIPLLNGIDIDNKLIAYGLTSKQIVNGFANIICNVNDYGIIEHIGGDPHITLGVKKGLHNQQAINRLTPIIENVAQDLKRAQVNVSIKDDISDAVWAKYLFVSPWAAISSLVEQPLSQIRSNPQCYLLLQQLLDEYVLIAKADGVTVAPRLLENIKKGLERLPPESTTSMQNDVEQGRATEFDTLVASAFHLSEKHKLSSPILTWCYSCLAVKVNAGYNNYK